MFAKVLKAGFIFVGICSFAAPAGATTAQFLSRLYTEGLGRAPDPGTWKANPLFLATPSNCTSLDFASLAINVYTSSEYNNLAYTNKEKILTLYRGILNREPESASAIQYYASLLDSGSPITSLINEFVSSSEFANLRNNKICAPIPIGQDTLYTWGQQPAIPLDAGASSMSAATLQGLINTANNGANKVVSLPQGTVVYADQTIFIPAGVTLTTAGNIVRGQYAKMARIVRSANFSDSTIVMYGSTGTQPGAVLDRIWVAGQRNQIVNGTTINYTKVGYSVLISSGNNASVINSRFDTPVGGTNIGIDGSEPTGVACNHVSVSGNILTAYSNTHYGGQNYYPFSDGITSKCADTTIANNTVMDASDVAIIQFYTAGLQNVQASKATGNLIISTGVSTFAAMMYEPFYYAGSTPIVRDFTGASFSGNTFFAAEGTRFEIGISAGRRPWNNLTSYINGGEVSNNTNAGIPTTMQVGIGVGYAKNTSVTNNSLNYSPYTKTVAQDPLAKCPTRSAIVTDNIQNTTIIGNTSNGSSALPVAGDLTCNF